MADGGSGGAWSQGAEGLWAALRDDDPLPEGELRGLLGALGADPPPAVWHPTGFVVLVLGRGEQGTLRLHLWPAGAREHGQPCWPVHDHVWDLRSQVLCGSLESRESAVVDDDRGDAVLYAVDYGEGRCSCMRRSERRVSVRAQDSRTVATGERYAVAAGVFHATHVAAGDFAATLAVTRPTGRSHPWVVGAVDGPAVVPVERPVAHRDQVQALLRRLAATS